MIKTSDTVLLEKYVPLTLFERVVCERELETEQNCNILTPTLLAITAFLFRSPGLLNRGPGAHSAGCWLSLPHLVSNWSGLQLTTQSGAWGPTLLGAGFLYSIFTPTGPYSKLTDFLSSPSYIIVQRPLLLVGVTIALIQPIHGQGYNSDIPRPDAPVIYIGAFPILTARPGRRSIYNSYIAWSGSLCWVMRHRKCVETNDLTYFDECHTVEVVVLCRICVGRGARRQIGAWWISPFSFSTWHIMSFVFTTVNSPIQSRCDNWAIVDCSWWIKTLSPTCIGSL